LHDLNDNLSRLSFNVRFWDKADIPSTGLLRELRLVIADRTISDK
jgi:hypothetical protein